MLTLALRRPSRALATLLLAALTAAAAPQQGTDTAEYRVLDDVEGVWVDLNFPAVDPLVFAGGSLWAVNTYGNELVRFDDLSGEAAERYPMPWAPVSVAPWTSPDDGGLRLLVSTRGTHSLAVLDAERGRLEALIALPSEPADVLVDADRHKAWVACSGADSVAEIDLRAMEMTAEHAIPAKHPMFLADDGQGGVLVAPMISGNNSITDLRPNSVISVGFRGILDLDDPTIAVGGGLPDEDLFRLDPDTGALEVLAQSVGTLLFDLGVNPATGEVWMLTIEALNKDPDRQDEPAVKGDFVSDRLRILDSTTLTPTGPVVRGVGRTVDLDVTGLGGPLSQPWALAFLPDGKALVAATQTDNVLLLDAAGNPLAQFDESNGLPAGAIPRGVVVDSGLDRFYVHCWGTNTVEVFDLADGAHLATLDLGFDPSPFQRGRAIFFDAHNSERENASCASCHLETRTDFVLWNLSDPVADDKGPMLTQPLAGMSRTPPFHWRGEREGLVDFNGAFDGLLGGQRLDLAPGGEFEQFAAYLNSIQNPANPNQDRRRVVNAALAEVQESGMIGDPVRGQDRYFDEIAAGATSCNDCHTLPTGTSGDFIDDASGDVFPKRTHMEVGHYLEMWRKEQPLVDVQLQTGETYRLPTVGTGLTHAGLVPDVFAFVRDLFGVNPLDYQADIVSFMRQVDQGLAPAVHQAFLLDRFSGARDVAEVRDYLLDQAHRRHCDVGAFGTAGEGANRREGRWVYDPESRTFLAQDSRLSALRYQELVARARKVGANLVFVGLPRGSAERFAIDYDFDGAKNGDELRAGTDPYERDTDGDGFHDGHELDHSGDPLDPAVASNDNTPPTATGLGITWKTSKVARLTWTTDEPVRWEIDLQTEITDSPPTFQNLEFASPLTDNPLDRFQTVHSVILSDLLPSTEVIAEFEYTGTLTLTDRGGNQVQVPIPPFTTVPFTGQAKNQVLLRDLRLENLFRLGDTLIGDVVPFVVTKSGGPPGRPVPGRLVVLRVFRNGELYPAFTSSLPTNIAFKGQPGAVPGPYLTGESDPNGEARIDFNIPGLVPGDKLTFVVEYVLKAPKQYPTKINVTDDAPNTFWDFASTPPEARTVEVVY